MKRHGFTLIELLVVIAIIAGIIGFVFPNFLSARERARDTKKKAELRELKNALRLYYNDYRTYPGPTTSGLYINGCGTGSPPSTQCGTSFDGNGTTYMRAIPDFNGASLGYGFNYCSTGGGDDFRIKVVLENQSDTDAAASQSRCPPPAATCLMSYLSYEYVVCAD